MTTQTIDLRYSMQHTYYSPSLPIRQSEKSSSVYGCPYCRVLASTPHCSTDTQVPAKLRVPDPALQASRTLERGSTFRFSHDLKYLLYTVLLSLAILNLTATCFCLLSRLHLMRTRRIQGALYFEFWVEGNVSCR